MEEQILNIEIALNTLAIILFIGFAIADFLTFSVMDKQKDIEIFSRYGRRTGPLEIVYANVALLAVAYMLYCQSYRFLPCIVAFLLLIILNGRLRSGIAPTGVFVGSTYLEWGKIYAYKIVNDAISTIEVQVYANQKRYVLRCTKEQRKQIDHYFIEHNIMEKVEA